MAIKQKNSYPFCLKIQKKLGWPYAKSAEYGVTNFGTVKFGNEYTNPAVDDFGIYQQRHCIGGVKNIQMRFYRPTNPRTAPQQSNRTKFAQAVSAWQELTAEQKESYNARAKGKNYHGYNLFISEYQLS